MSNFFGLPRGDRWYLLGLIAFSAVSFLPFWRDIVFAGMSAFGWLMALLMVISPSIALYRFLRSGGRRGAGGGTDDR